MLNKFQFWARRIEPQKIVVEVGAGVDIGSTVGEALQMAIEHMCTVEFKFNDRKITIDPKTIIYAIVDEQYNSTFGSDET